MDTAPAARPRPDDRGKLSALLRLRAVRPPVPRADRPHVHRRARWRRWRSSPSRCSPRPSSTDRSPTATAAGWFRCSALALVFGIAEAALFFLRRWAMNRSCLRIERDLRDTLYQRLQRLPVAFHDRWASGQLLSRATHGRRRRSAASSGSPRCSSPST